MRGELPTLKDLTNQSRLGFKPVKAFDIPRLQIRLLAR